MPRPGMSLPCTYVWAAYALVANGDPSMRLADILNRRVPPEPWDEGDKIPWDDPDFSRRMLQEHLAQTHDRASRRASIIDQHVAWIHGSLLGGRPGRILDLGCGPGLYTSRLASLGHDCFGIDFSPAAIDYARAQSEAQRLTCRYLQGDVRTSDFGTDNDLVLLIFGEFNMFTRVDALKILRKTRDALAADGILLLEAHTSESVEAMGHESMSWRSAARGVFSDRPHLVLNEHFWHEEQRVASQRTFVIDAGASSVNRYVETAQAYTLDDYAATLREAGLSLQQSHPALPGSPESGEFVVLIAGHA